MYLYINLYLHVFLTFWIAIGRFILMKRCSSNKHVVRLLKMQNPSNKSVKGTVLLKTFPLRTVALSLGNPCFGKNHLPGVHADNSVYRG